MSFKTSTNKLIVRPLTKEDVVPYFKLIQVNRAHLSQFHVMSEARYKTQKELLDSITHPKNSQKIRYGVRQKDHIVGFASLVNKGHRRCEIGMWIGQDFTRRGFASDVVRSLAKYALDELGYTRVIATVDPRNEASKNTLLKSGFRLVRRFKRRHYFAFVE